MRIITRTKYLNKLINVIGTPDIKVITGLRRSGKSKLLESFISYLKDNIKNSNIIFIDFNSIKYEHLKDYHALNDYIEGLYKQNFQNIICIDEVQMCPSFELTINSLHSSEKYDIYITGSNAFLLSSDLATLFTGRTFEIEIFPFSFKEYLQYFQLNSSDEAFDNYIRIGGMAGSYIYKSEVERYKYINSIFDTMIVRDLLNKYHIKNKAVLDDLINFMIDNVSSITSIRNIANSLINKRINTNDKTISNYIKYLCHAFVFYKIRRYDIKGKKYLASSDKYYISDHSFKYAKLGTKNMNYGHVYENMVAIELLRRGYEVYVGILYTKEIDFIAIKHNEKIYIQVSDDISNDATFKREIDSLLKIKDAYPKMLIARTKHSEYSYEGIKIIDIAFWLNND